MIVYNKQRLENSLLIDDTKVLKEAGFITNDQVNANSKGLETLKTQNNLLIRIGLFILGIILYGSICGTLSLFSMGAFEHYYKIIFILFAIIGIAGSEFMSHNLYYFGYGLDDAFVLGAIMWFCIAIGVISDGDEFVISSTLVLLSAITYLRYLHAYTALLLCFGIAGCVFYGSYNLVTIGKMIIPFALMIVAVFLYFVSKKGKSTSSLSLFTNGFQVIYGFSLVLFYAAGNYLVVRELSKELMGTAVPAGKDIPFAFLFYGFTFIFPIAYIVFSLFQKDRIMLWIGILAFGFSIYTIRFYYHLLPVEVALTLGGIVLFVFTYFSIKKLKNKTNGVTFKPDRFQNQSFTNAETLLVATKFGIQPEIPTPENNIDFGGGGFSGGGSSGGF